MDPSVCCQISKPFDRLNFPDCFDDVDETSTARNEITNRDDRGVRDTIVTTTQPRFNVGERNLNSNDNRRSERVPTTDNRDSDSGEEDRRDNRPNGKPRWGFNDSHRHGGGWPWHHGGHGDYHSFGAGGRYRHKRQLDQVVVRTSVRAQITLQSGVGNGNVMTKSIPFVCRKIQFFFLLFLVFVLAAVRHAMHLQSDESRRK